MCYTGCYFERFNPVTGNSQCKRGKNPCPEDEDTGDNLVVCSHCDWEFINIDGECPNCSTEYIE